MREIIASHQQTLSLAICNLCVVVFKSNQLNFSDKVCFAIYEQQKRISYEPPHDKTNKMICAHSEDSDQPGHPSGLGRVLAVRMKKHWAINYLFSAQ